LITSSLFSSQSTILVLRKYKDIAADVKGEKELKLEELEEKLEEQFEEELEQEDGRLSLLLT
jgi:hypothetical protein